jgi:hypothetical protein
MQSVIERTFAWFVKHSRSSRVCEQLCTTREALIFTAMGPLMLRRLAQS